MRGWDLNPSFRLAVSGSGVPGWAAWPSTAVQRRSGMNVQAECFRVGFGEFEDSGLCCLAEQYFTWINDLSATQYRKKAGTNSAVDSFANVVCTGL